MRSLVHQLLTVLTGRATLRASQFVSLLFLARILSVEEFGWFGVLSTSLALLATIGSFGLRQSFAFKVGKEELKASEAFGVALVLLFPFTLLSAVPAYFYYAHKQSSVSPALLMLFLAVVLFGLISLQFSQGINLGLGDIKGFALGETLPQALFAFAMCALFFYDTQSLSLVLLVYGTCYLAVLPTFILRSRKTIGSILFPVQMITPLVRTGIVFAFNLFLILACTRLPMYILNETHGANSAGNFFAALRLGDIFMEVAAAFGMVLFSNASREKQTGESLARLSKVCRLSVPVLGVLSIIAITAAPFITPIVYGTKYSESVILFQIIMLSLPSMALNKIIYPTLAGSGYPKLGTVNLLIGVLVTAISTFVFAHLFGALGGALALVLGQISIHFGYIRICSGLTNSPFREFFYPSRSDLTELATLTRTLVARRRKRN